ncbi:MAG: DNA mismatch repair protein MutS [Promethearchaeota archaeon]
MTGNQATSKFTPMQAQWQKFRRMYDKKEYILAFRMGDFFEFFDDDAKLVSKILDITCTTRQGRPLAGFPYVSGHENLERIVKSGWSVVVVDQVESPDMARARGSKVVKRDVVRVITPGTVLDDTVLERDSNNYLASMVVETGKKNPSVVKISMAFCDLSTGDFFTTEFVDNKKDLSTLNMILGKFSPVELLLSEKFNHEDIQNKVVGILPGLVIRYRPAYDFEVEECRALLLSHFKVSNLDGYGIGKKLGVISSSGALLLYLQENQKKILHNITSSYHYNPTRYMQIDHHAIRNLEILRNNSDGGLKGSLFELFSKTCTTMGARQVKKMLISPLMDVKKINDRLDFVEYLIKNLFMLDEIKEALSGICDLERLISRINYSSSVNSRHLVQLARSLEKLPTLQGILSEIGLRYPQARLEKIHDFSTLTSSILNTFVDEPPPRINEGGMIKTGVNPELDELRDIRDNSHSWLNNFQERMRTEHGITTLKVKYNKVFGYFIEVSKSHVDKVPKEWVRKQTLVNAERYINPELKKMEEKILNAEEKIHEIERKLFEDMKQEVITYTDKIQVSARALAEIDAMITFASVASSSNYCRPEVDTGGDIYIKEGRHPTIEKIMGMDKFISNDIEIRMDKNILNIVTGPNMSGKSTYLRQICLIVILAQVGTFVPATLARIGIVDKIFSRVGASDDITRSKSTFLVEMSETSYILNHATDKSLVILDELGRGTSTFDGVSLAWAVAEYLHEKRVKTLFATHYHQLADLESFLPLVKNLNVIVKENEMTKELVFLHKVEEGVCDKSYGIQVARLAGLPEPVLKRASDILERLTSDDPLTTDRIRLIGNEGISRPVKPKTRKKPTKQLTLVPMALSPIDEKLMEVKKELEMITINTLTPLDALNLLKELKEKLNL